LPSSEQSKKFEGPLGIALSVKLLSDSSTMYKATYQRNFRAATECAVTFARDHVINVVPEGRLFLIYTNQSHDGNPLRSDETLYPGDALPTESNPLPRTEEEAIDSLWRFGKVPEWIDVAVARIEEGNTYLRSSAVADSPQTNDFCITRGQPRPGSALKSPDLPPNWLPAAKSVKFDLHWKVNDINI
jgi:hypothetical protein